MPIYSKKEFAEVCGCSIQVVSMNIKRGNLIDTNNVIDTGKRDNKDFMNRKLGIVAPVVEVAAVEVPELIPKPKPKAPILRKTTRPKPASSETPEEAERYNKKTNLDLQLKNLQVEKAAQDVELNKIKIAKQRGEVIPTGLVNVTVGQIFKGVTVAFHQGADNFISNIAKKTGMSREDQASLRTELIDIINQSVVDGQKENKDAIKHIVNEYSEKRAVGESR
jgi:hypothetical protein